MELVFKIIIGTILVTGIPSISIIIYDGINKLIKKITEILEYMQLPKNKQVNLNLSFEECNIIIDNIVDDIWKNKYFLNYRLRELTIIPSMDTEIANFVREVTESISPDVLSEATKYYTYDYLIKKITRTAQMLFVEYTNTYKPSTK